MLQAPMLDGLAFDTGPFGQYVCRPAEVDVSRGQVLQALVVAVIVVVVDEGADLASRSPGRK